MKPTLYCSSSHYFRSFKFLILLVMLYVLSGLAGVTARNMETTVLNSNNRVLDKSFVQTLPRSGQLQGTRIAIEKVLADMSSMPGIELGKHRTDKQVSIPEKSTPGNLLVQATLKFDNRNGQDTQLKMNGYLIAEGKEPHQLRWVDMKTKTIWQGKLSAGDQLDVTFHSQAQLPLFGPAKLVITLTDPAGHVLWLRSDQFIIFKAG